MLKKRLNFSIVMFALLLVSIGIFPNAYQNLTDKLESIKNLYVQGNSTTTNQDNNNTHIDASSQETQTQVGSSQNINEIDEMSNKTKGIVLNNVPFIQQLPELERGCEVTSLAMLLQYAGVSVDKMTLAGEIQTVPFSDGDLRGNPNEGFVGSLYSLDDSGYGVYHGPIFQLAQKYLSSQAVDLTGKNIQDVYNMIDIGAPVWIITNATYAPLDDNEFETWQTNSGSVQITYSEHSVVIVGYDQNNVYINDPLANSPKTAVPRSDFEKAWVQMGSQAISYYPANN